MWLFDPSGLEKPKPYTLNYKDNIIIYNTGGEKPFILLLYRAIFIFTYSLGHMQTFKNYLQSQLVHNFTFYFFLLYYKHLHGVA